MVICRWSCLSKGTPNIHNYRRYVFTDYSAIQRFMLIFHVHYICNVAQNRATLGGGGGGQLKKSQKKSKSISGILGWVLTFFDPKF